MTKLFYSDDQKLLYSRNWPDVPEVKASIYQDQAAMNQYEKELNFLIDPVRRVEVVNHEYAMTKVVWNSEKPIEKGQFYSVKADHRIFSKEGKYYCEIL